tara:strand:+ start:1510 stop:1923 length:414 start_codon:yes stop_codon:yes gene_type:complete
MKNVKKKKTDMRTVIRKIVREEVAMAIQEVITELKQPTQSTKPMTPKKRTQNSSFTSNKVLNDVLNETAQDGDWKTLGGGEFTTERMQELVGGQYGDMMNTTPQQVPSSDPMAQFLNKDYSEVLQKAEQKQKQKYGK